jgi:photosystem II stability/assembly factor-like uncharacterized protein
MSRPRLGPILAASLLPIACLALAQPQSQPPSKAQMQAKSPTKTVYLAVHEYSAGPTDAPVRFRGVSAVSKAVAWASGTKGTIVRTADGGDTWQTLPVPDAAALDFRDIDAIDERTAYALSIGPGEASRIYKTIDAGHSWRLQYTNHDPKAFFDAMTFSDARHGVVMSDSVDGQFVIMRTANGGATWTPAPKAGLPPALPNEGAFAASGSNVAVFGTDHIWIGTGAASTARVLRSIDGGRTWQVSATPLASGASAGIFSIAFRDALHGVIVGGDYKKEAEAVDNVAVTADGGVTWTLVRDKGEGLSGFRSAVAYVPGTSMLLAVGPSGADLSTDDGHTWTAWTAFQLNGGLHTFGFARQGTSGWGAGERGRIVRIDGLDAVLPKK